MTGVGRRVSVMRTGTAVEADAAVDDLPPHLARAWSEARGPIAALNRALADPSTPVSTLATVARVACDAVSQLSTLASAAQAARSRC